MDLLMDLILAELGPCIKYVYLFLFVLQCYTSHYNKRLLTYKLSQKKEKKIEVYLIFCENTTL